MAISVVLADDHTVVRDGLRLLLEASGDIRVIGEAADGRSAVRRVKRLQPDIVLMDIAMPELNGIEATSRIRETCPRTRVIVLSMHDSKEYIHRALKAGASGYLLKDSAGKEVVKAVRQVITGHYYLSEKVTRTAIEKLIAESRGETMPSDLDRLSPREREVLQMVVEGYTSAEIAETLNLSPKTVDTYRSRLMDKLGVKGLPELVKFAIRHGLTQVE